MINHQDNYYGRHSRIDQMDAKLEEYEPRQWYFMEELDLLTLPLNDYLNTVLFVWTGWG